MNPQNFLVVIVVTILGLTDGADDDYNLLRKDGSFDFGYENPDSYHHAKGSRNNIVRGEFGARNPGTGQIDSTIYTAGPRGYRPRGKNVHRKYDLNQNGPRPIGSRDDPYYDPFEDPSYSFGFKTRTHSRQESANRVGDVTGKYSYVDDVGERHNVEYIAGKNTGFHVKTPYPDSNPNILRPLYFNGRGKPIPRGRTSIQKGLDGSYQFVSAGPDQRRTETSDGLGHVRGSYTYLDDKGVQHSVHYIAGPETGYQVLKNVKGPHLPSIFFNPLGRPDIIPPPFYDEGDFPDTGDLFDTAASGPGVTKPRPGGSAGGNKKKPSLGGGLDVTKDDLDTFGNNLKPPSSTGGGSKKPSYDYDDGGSDDEDLFGGGGGGGSGGKPGGSSSGSGSGGSIKPSTYRPPLDGSYIPPGDPNQDDGKYRPGPNESGLGTGPGGSSGDEIPKPGLGTDNDDNDDSLFGSESGDVRPSGGRPIIQVQGGSTGGGGGGCEKCKGTIVTNVGDRLFTVPPGVSVRAHVQSIDLLALEPPVPSPSEQLKKDLRTEQLNSEKDNLVDRSGDGNSTSSEVTEGPSTTTVESTTSDKT